MIKHLRRRATRGEEGSALVLALIFVTVIALWISAVLTFTDTAFRSTRVVTRQRAAVYAADGAMDAAIRKVQAEGPCQDLYNAPPMNGMAVKVDCQPPLKPNANNQFLNPSRALAIDELTADAVLVAGGADAAAITLTGYGPPTPTPPVTSTYIRVSHTADVNVSLEAKIVANPATPDDFVKVSIPPNTTTTLSENYILVTGLVGVSLVNAQVTYTATRVAVGDAAAALDGISLEVTYGTGPAAQTAILKPTGHDQFENPTNAYQMGEPSPAVATASLATAAATTASVALTGYSRLTIPTDAVIEEAVLRAKHGDDPDIAKVSITIEAPKRSDGSATTNIVLSADTTTPCSPDSLCLHPTVGEDRIDLLGLGLDDWAQFKAVRITYAVTLAAGANKSAVDSLDAIWIELAYAPEGFPHAPVGTKPNQAIFTAGGPGLEDGLHLRPGSIALVHNGVVSKSTISVESGARLEVQQGGVKAGGGCTGAGVITPACMTGPVTTAPAYKHALPGVPEHRSPGDCTGKQTVRLEPGYYDDAAALSKLTSGDACGAAAILLNPGVYYFDFAFGVRRGLAGTVCATAGKTPCTWTIDRDVRVVGGTPKRWDPNKAANPPFPGACNPNRDGVQLVFGGLSRMDLGGNASMELCPVASTAAEKQRIAIYGLTSTTAPPEKATLEATTHDQFANPTNAFQIGGGTADARLTTSGPRSASIELNGFAPFSLPLGQVVTKAVLKVGHADSGDVAAVQAVVTDDAATKTFSSTDNPCFLCVHSGQQVDELVLTGRSLSGLRVRFVVSLAGGASAFAAEALDGITLELTYGLPLSLLPPTTVTLPPTGHNQFANPDNLLRGSPDGAMATASSTVPATAAVSLRGYDQVAVPAGATIKEAVLHLAHQESAGVTVTATVAGKTTPITPTTTDLSLLPLDPTTLQNLTVTYTASLAPAIGATAIAALHAISLEITYSLATPNQALLDATGHDQFVNPANAFQIGETPAVATADAQLATGRAAGAAITLTGFGVTLAQPPSKITLRVAHRDSSDVSALKATVIARDGTKVAIPFGSCSSNALCIHGDLREDRVDLSLTPSQLADFWVRYEVELAPGAAKSATEQLDGVWVEVQHGSPAVTDVLKPTGHDQFTSPANSVGIDGSGATTTLVPGGPTSALTLHGYNQIALPAGAIIDGAILRVTHADPTNIGRVSVAVGGANSVDLPLRRMGLGEDQIELTSASFDASGAFKGLSIRYEVALAPGAAGSATDTLDGIVVELRYRRAPMLEALTGCSITVPASSGCPFFSTSTSARLALHGTVYAPTAAVDISLRDVANVALGRGLISRTAQLDMQPRAGYLRPFVIVPDDEPAPRTRVFTAYVDDKGKVKELLRATVRFDPSGVLTVLSWSVLP